MKGDDLCPPAARECTCMGFGLRQPGGGLHTLGG
jgi:hypothetical protein